MDARRSDDYFHRAAFPQRIGVPCADDSGCGGGVYDILFLYLFASGVQAREAYTCLRRTATAFLVFFRPQIVSDNGNDDDRRLFVADISPRTDVVYRVLLHGAGHCFVCLRVSVCVAALPVSQGTSHYSPIGEEDKKMKKYIYLPLRRDKKEGCPFHKDNPLFIVLFYPYLSTVYTFGVFPELFLRVRKRKKVCEQECSFAVDNGRIHLFQ